MPVYNVETIIPLSTSQQDDLAQGITKLHATRFSTPSMFVNVVFHDVTNLPTYVGGKRHPCNKLIGNVRNGPQRTQEEWEAHNNDILKLWGGIVGTDGDRELRAIFIMGGLIAAAEAGLANFPAAGEEKQWFKKNYAYFKEKADAGDEDFKGLIEAMTGAARPGQMNGH